MAWRWRGRLMGSLVDLVWPIKTNRANERFAKHLWNHRDQLFTFLEVPGLDATNWCAEQAIRGGVVLAHGLGRQSHGTWRPRNPC